MKMFGETGSPWRASLSKLKYWVVVPLFITHDCWSFTHFSLVSHFFIPFIPGLFFQRAWRQLVFVKYLRFSYGKLDCYFLWEDFSVYPRKFRKILLLTHRYKEFCYSSYFFMESNRSVSLVLLLYGLYCSFVNVLVLRELKSHYFLTLGFEKFCLKSVSWNVLMLLDIALWLVIPFSSVIRFLIWF